MNSLSASHNSHPEASAARGHLRPPGGTAPAPARDRESPVGQRSSVPKWIHYKGFGRRYQKSQRRLTTAPTVPHQPALQQGQSASFTRLPSTEIIRPGQMNCGHRMSIQGAEPGGNAHTGLKHPPTLCTRPWHLRQPN